MTETALGVSWTGRGPRVAVTVISSSTVVEGAAGWAFREANETSERREKTAAERYSVRSLRARGEGKQLMYTASVEKPRAVFPHGARWSTQKRWFGGLPQVLSDPPLRFFGSTERPRAVLTD
jgi:hypothetical protein